MIIENYFCDGCGEQIRYLHYPHNEKRLDGMTTEKLPTADGYGRRDKKLDLCPTCVRRYKKFVNIGLVYEEDEVLVCYPKEKGNENR